MGQVIKIDEARIRNHPDELAAEQPLNPKDRLMKLHKQTVEAAIIQLYQRHERLVETALIRTPLTGISVCRIKDITEALRGTWVN